MTTLKLVFLGTSSAVPTAERGLSSVAVVRGGEILLFDAGEGVQRSFSKAGLGFNRPMKIFVTHMHGDHCVGLLGLLQTMSMVRRTEPLSIYGPRGIVGFVKNNLRSLKFDMTFQLQITQVREGVIAEEKEYVVKSCRGEHYVVNYAYALEEKVRPGVFYPKAAVKLGVPEGRLWSRLQNGETVEIGGKTVHPSQVLGSSRPGRKIVLSGDTRPTSNLKRFIHGADVAVLDSTYFDDYQDKAEEHLHMTAREAAEIASEAAVKRLILTHFSSRYEDVAPYLSQASQIHPDTVAASDFLIIEVPYPDDTRKT